MSTLQSEEAKHAWRALIEQNPECYDYYRGILSNEGINLGNCSQFEHLRALANPYNIPRLHNG
jgi:N-alpha-acetyltransferase 15/16, NatA auxiliary subunit